MRIVLALLLVALSLAGCSDGGGSDDPADAPSVSATTTGPPPKPVVTSDTLHLLALPDMAPVLPEGSNEYSTPTMSGNFGGGGGGQGDDEPEGWSYEVQQATNVTGGEIRIWVEIVETMYQVPDPRPDSTCTWILQLELGADNDADVPCLTEPAGPINPGTKELVFSFLATDAFELEQNETVFVRLDRRAFSLSTNNAVNILSGSEAHDSRVQLDGLKEIVED